ncbi:MAG: FtsX-like permease family protein, partial [Gammaproteobacteria bacterium]|nr:FtsX-like permease family protein [Gammaproteobacteria bacterium]
RGRRFMQESKVQPAIEIRLKEPMAAPRLARQLKRSLPSGVDVQHWGEQQSQYFHAVKIEKIMMFVILLLIVAIAALNIVTSLVMFVKDKRFDIAILRTMGAAKSSVSSAFFLLGAIAGGMGAIVGLVLGVALTLNVGQVQPLIEWILGRELFPSDVYLVSGVPAKLMISDVLWVAVFALILSFIAGFYPARRAAKVQPGDVLRTRA